jgi:hypothetical protein
VAARGPHWSVDGGKIGFNGEAAATLRLDRSLGFGQAVAIARHRRDVRAGIGQHAADFLADALGSTGDQRGLAGQRETLREFRHRIPSEFSINLTAL